MGIREAILNEVRQQSLEKGKASGDEKRIRIAVGRMHGKGLPETEIAEFLGVSGEKVQSILSDLGVK